MSYLFNTPAQQQEMLRTIGVESIAQLFAEQIPEAVRLQRPLDLPPPLSEMELEQELSTLASRNVGAGQSISPCFLGGGAYDHFIPAAVDTIASRSEYYTAYTPYQAEASQGTLQVFFEYQSLICQLTGMDVSNASLYEAGTAVTEAVIMAQRATNRTKKIVVLGSVHPEYRAVLKTYLHQLNTEIIRIPCPQGTADLQQVAEALDADTACLVIQQPNFFGCLEEAKDLVDLAHKHGALAIVAFDPISLGILPRPGDYGVDIAVAEGQSLGTPLQYGGPYLGILTCRSEFVRRMPGRLIGETTDRQGNRCFVLNLQAREQHIRRDKATSNICTNQGLLAIRATAYLSLLGPQGLREVAELSLRKAHYAAQQLATIPGLSLMFDKPFFKEFTLRCEGGAYEKMHSAFFAEGEPGEFLGGDIGPDLQRFQLEDVALRPELEQGLLLAVTEKRTKTEIDDLVRSLRD